MVGVPNTEFRCVAAQAVPRVPTCSGSDPNTDGACRKPEHKSFQRYSRNWHLSYQRSVMSRCARGQLMISQRVRKTHIRSNIHPDLATEVRERQGNTRWPNALANTRPIEVVLLRGQRNPSIVQRIAAWLIGTGLAMVALTFALLANEKNAPLLFWFSVPIFFVAGRIFANGFSKRR